MRDWAFDLGSSWGTFEECLCWERMAEIGWITRTLGRTTLAPVLLC